MPAKSKDYCSKEVILLDTITNLTSYGNYSPVGDFHCGRARIDVFDSISNNILRGYIDNNGYWSILPFCLAYEVDKELNKNYDGDFHDGYAVVCSKDSSANIEFFYVDTSGRRLFDYKLNWIFDFNDGYACVSMTNKGVFYINTDGKSQSYMFFSDRNKDLFSFEEKGKFGIKNFDGTILREANYDKVEFCGCGYIKVWDGQSYYFLDTIFERIDVDRLELCDEMINIYSTSECYMGVEGKVIASGYSYLNPFSDGLGCAVNNNDEFVYLNNKGHNVMSFGKDTVCYSFNNGFAKIMVNKKYGLIDKFKNEVMPIKYDYIGDTYENNYVLVKIDNVYKYLKIIDCVDSE